MNLAIIRLLAFLAFSLLSLWLGCWFLSICPHWAEYPTLMSMMLCFFGGLVPSAFAASEIAAADRKEPRNA